MAARPGSTARGRARGRWRAPHRGPPGCSRRRAGELKQQEKVTLIAARARRRHRADAAGVYGMLGDSQTNLGWEYFGIMVESQLL